MKKKIPILILLFFGCSISFGQQKDMPRDKDAIWKASRIKALQAVMDNLINLELNFSERIEIQEKFGFPNEIILQDGLPSKLQYLDESNHPVYYTTFNIDAAKTTRTAALQSGGELNLNLTGKGMVAGIYDQTRPKRDHIEFGNRLTQVDGSTETISNHATHVTGTIMAAGSNNSSVKGMANEVTGWAFNWESDVSKMTQNGYDPDLNPQGTIVSNHSYGIVLGWFRNAQGNWQWAGNTSISSEEDYRFGFYSSKSASLDNLAFAKPYYTIVWAAGNDRNDVGDGSRPSDGPSDTIGPEGTAKNNITVGAVSAVTNYTGPNSVSISNFSSWGPVDDGRIKPDLVAMGVNVFSTGIADGGAQDSYVSLSGTSMAAPNVSGSLMLLQQLYASRNNNRYMRSATLKALAIHTAREAGQAPGPDYIYGWGLMDSKRSAEIILNEDGASNVISEQILGQGEVFESSFISDGISPIRVTIAWTDPAGTPVSPALNPTNLMLVNDLDLRIFDESGKEFFPWTLNPSQANNARAVRTQDNFRDNVEQVLIDNPLPSRYTIKVSHKNSLTNGLQPFSMIVTAGAADGGSETLYWIGGNGNWNNPSNWSLTQGGTPANRIPGQGTRVIFEPLNGNSSFDVGFSGNADAFSVNLFGNTMVDFDLGGRNLEITSGFRVSNQITNIKNGNIVFRVQGDRENLVDFGTATFDNVSVNFNQGNWKVLEVEAFDQLQIAGARVDFEIPTLKVKSISMTGQSRVLGNFQNLIFSENFNLAAPVEFAPQLNVTFSGQAGEFRNNNSKRVRELKVQAGTLDLISGSNIQNLLVEGGTLKINPSVIEVEKLVLSRGVTLDLMTGNSVNVKEEFSILTSGSGSATITASEKGTILHDVYRKYCFGNTNVTNVDLEGQAIINLGTGAQLTNAENWLTELCENVLFANFNVKFACVGSFVEFENLSDGNIDTYLWTFGSLGTSNLESPNFVFEQAGEYEVSLEISNDLSTTTYNQTIVIGDNPLNQPVIVVNGNVLTSQTIGNSYQWYRNGVRIPGATARSYTVDNDGAFQVAIFNGQCNRVSAPEVISSITTSEPELSRFGIFIGPNPTSDFLDITLANEYIGEVEIALYSVSGQMVENVKLLKGNYELNYNFYIHGPKGMYILLIQTDTVVLPKKIIKK